MSSALTIDGKEYILATLAGKQFGYTKDYFLMLAKQGKVDGQKVGNRWYINVESARLFFNEAKNRKQERSEQIRKERKLELKHHTKAQAKQKVKHKGYARAAVVETLVILIIGLSLGATGYIGTSSNIAAAGATEHNFFENLAVSIYEFFSPSTTISTDKNIPQNTNTQPSAVTDDSAVSAQITYTSLVVAPDEIFTATTIESVRNSFSDEVNVSVDLENPDTGVIVPVFKDREGEAYRFLMVPVNQSNN